MTGRVVLEEGTATDFGAVTLAYSPRYIGGKEGTGAPGRFGSMRGTAPGDLGGVDADGAFRVRIPRVPSGAVVARAPGWLPAWAEVDVALADPSHDLLLVLKPGVRLRGTLKDSNGAPVAGATVRVYVVIKLKDGEMDTSAVGRIRAGFTFARSVKGGWVRHRLKYGPRTDKNGRWEVDLDAAGEVHVAVLREGHAPTEHLVGPAEFARESIDLTLRPALPVTIRITRAGEPVRDSKLTWVDLTNVDVQRGLRLETDEGGYVRSPWLVRGKRYGVAEWGRRSSFFVYRGQDTIDLDAIEQDFDTFVGNR